MLNEMKREELKPEAKIEKKPVLIKSNKKNEPLYLLQENKKILDLITEDNVHYPDMYKAYNIFEKTFKINKKNFILTNGCENALRIAISLFKNRTSIGKFYYEQPGWRLPMFCAYQAGIPKENILPIEYMANPGIDVRLNRKPFQLFHTFELDDNTLNSINEKDILYKTMYQNGWISHNDEEFKYVATILNLKNGPFRIYDDSYTLSSLLHFKSKLNALLSLDNTIIIGSFSKALGAGYRLAFVLFNESYYEDAQLLKEQYLSSSGIKLLDTIANNKTTIMKYLEKEFCRKNLKNSKYFHRTITYDTNLEYFKYDHYPFYNRTFLNKKNIFDFVMYSYGDICHSNYFTMIDIDPYNSATFYMEQSPVYKKVMENLESPEADALKKEYIDICRQYYHPDNNDIFKNFIKKYPIYDQTVIGDKSDPRLKHVLTRFQYTL